MTIIELCRNNNFKFLLLCQFPERIWKGRSKGVDAKDIWMFTESCRRTWQSCHLYIHWL